MEEQGWRHKTVCIVDDDENIRTIYRTKFVNDGFTVIAAKNGEEGLELIRKAHPDVVLLDIEMGVLGGVGVLQELKKDTELSKIPVVVLSNIEDQRVFEQIEGMGLAKYYLIKSLTETQKVVDITLAAIAER